MVHFWKNECGMVKELALEQFIKSHIFKAIFTEWTQVFWISCIDNTNIYNIFIPLGLEC